LVGQSGPAATTDARGFFRIPRAIVYGDHPLFIETDHSSGYAHRYRVMQDALESLILYRFNEARVQGWLSQLEGGVSVQSGLMIGTVPGLAASVEPGSVLVPTVQPLQTEALVPEVYTLSPRDHLKVASVLSAEQPRFISVQLPRGPAMAIIEDRNRDVIFSELFFASPGVVNVLGPY
jgi:hypothetical protein